MQFSAACVAAFAATTMAGPILKRAVGDIAVIKKEVFVYPNGEVVKTAYETYTTNVPIPTVAPVAAPKPKPTPAAVVAPKPSAVPAPIVAPPKPSPSPASAAAPAAPAASGGQFLATGGSSSQSSSSSSSVSSLVDIASGLVNYIDAFAKQDVKTVAAFVDPNTDANSLFARMSLFHHNVHRANATLKSSDSQESVPLKPLEWDSTLAQAAQEWANSCTMEETTNGQNYGMNAAWSTSPENFNPSAWISDAWHNGELDEYPWNIPADQVSNDEKTSNFKRYGHLSQLLWGETQKVGCGIRSDCNSNMPNDGKTLHAYAACYYYPPGNYPKQFAQVGRPNGGPTVAANGDKQ